MHTGTDAYAVGMLLVVARSTLLLCTGWTLPVVQKRVSCAAGTARVVACARAGCCVCVPTRVRVRVRVRVNACLWRRIARVITGSEDKTIRIWNLAAAARRADDDDAAGVVE